MARSFAFSNPLVTLVCFDVDQLMSKADDTLKDIMIQFISYAARDPLQKDHCLSLLPPPAIFSADAFEADDRDGNGESREPSSLIAQEDLADQKQENTDNYKTFVMWQVIRQPCVPKKNNVASQATL